MYRFKHYARHQPLTKKERFTISNGNFEGSREQKRQICEPDHAFPNTGSEAYPDHASDMPSDATQRVHIDPASRPPVRRPAAAAPQRTTAGQTASQAQRRAAASPASRNAGGKNRIVKPSKMTVIALCSIASVLLIAVIVTLCMMLSSPEDDGLILNNVYAAGVNLGGKTPEQAKQALLEATADTYTKLDMSVEVHDTAVRLTPDKTGAELDVDAVVDAAYNYGRTGSRAERQRAKNQSLTSSYVISVVPYLNLDTDYIQDAVAALGAKYSSTLSQPGYRVEGERPDLMMDPAEIDIDRVYQTLYITLGTPEYGLDTDKLYEQVLDAYDTNLFQVVGQISVVSPETLDLEALYEEICVKPVDAVLDELTYEVTPEVYGYGFYIDEVRALLADAQYGEEVAVPLSFLRPKVTEAELAGGLFETTLATYGTHASDDANLILNLKLVCRAIDGIILKADEIFSFNYIIGEPTASKGYKPVTTYVGANKQEVVGGGISQAASTLYYCALMADMEILERNNHPYAPGFIEVGLDADISYGTKDLRFKNTTGRPVRIDAKVTDAGALRIDIVGTANEAYSVDIVYETVRTYTPATLTTVMLKDNPDGYADGDVLEQPITGYDVCTYRIYRYTEPGSNSTRELAAFSHYDKHDKVVVQIQEDLPGPPSMEPEEPGDSIDPTEGAESMIP